MTKRLQVGSVSFFTTPNLAARIRKETAAFLDDLDK